MNIPKNFPSSEYESPFLNEKINLTSMGIILFILYFSLIRSFMLSLQLWLIVLMVSLLILLVNKLLIKRKGIIITNIDVLWFFYLIYFVMRIGFNGTITSSIIFDLVVYTSGILFLLLVKVNVSYFKLPLKIILIIGITYALSAVFQYLFPDIYISYILRLFGENEKSTIMNLFRNGAYTGFTYQTAHLAGYIISGVGILFFSNWKNKFPVKSLKILSAIILLIGLLLSAKRAHTIFGVVSLLFTSLLSRSNKKVFNFVLKFSISVVLILLLVIVLYSTMDFNNNSETPIVNFLMEIEYTIKGIIEGDDVSNGRFELYAYSWELFNDNILVGIGWREFIKYSVGLINPFIQNRGSHPHNIYLQLLTELGIVGFLLFIVPVLHLYYKTYRLLRNQSNHNNIKKWKTSIQFSFYYQTFFLLYGLTGNLLTDYNFLLTYFFACSISLSALVSLKTYNGKNGNKLIKHDEKTNRRLL